VAKLVPDGWRELDADGAGAAAERERATLTLLERALPDS
jgi:hypothetical protein